MVKIPWGASGLHGYRASAHLASDPDREPRMMTSVLAIRLEAFPDGPVTVDLLMADDGGRPLLLFENTASNDEAQKLAELPRTWWRCVLTELRVTG
jgi:hypothetical protein